MKDELKEAIKVCDNFMFERGDCLHDKNLPVTDVMNQYKSQFQQALAILDSQDFDPFNERGAFFQVAHKIVEDTIERSRREFSPMLIIEDHDPEIFKVIEVFNQLLKKCFDSLPIEHFSISLMVPWASFDAWQHPVKFLICNREEAKELRRKTIELMESGMSKPTASKIIQPSPARNPDPVPPSPVTPGNEPKKREGDPFKSDSFGSVLGESEDPYVAEVLRTKKRK